MVQNSPIFNLQTILPDFSNCVPVKNSWNFFTAIWSASCTKKSRPIFSDFSPKKCVFNIFSTIKKNVQLRNILAGLCPGRAYFYLAKMKPKLFEQVNQAGDMIMIYGVDKFSFPSGHASRAMAVAFFFLWLYPIHVLLSLPILVWSLTVAMSR